MGFAQSSGSCSLSLQPVCRNGCPSSPRFAGAVERKLLLSLEVTQLIIVHSACGELGVTANLIFVARVRFPSVTIKSMAK